MSASVKVMRSYDYCHFEVCLGTDENVSLEQVDEMRKQAARLADKAVRQYQIAKNEAASKYTRKNEMDTLRNEVAQIERLPEGDRTPNQQAKVKLLKDRNWQEYIDQRYDYDDDWNNEPE